MDTESGLTTCGTKGTSTTEQLPTNSDIADSTKDAFSKADLLLRNSAEY